FGWLLRGDESFGETVRRIGTRENATPANRPALTIDYTAATQGASTTGVTSGTNPSVFGQSVTFTATVAAGAPATGTPTGTVTFRDGTTNLGTGTLNASGVATFSTSALAVGSHAISVVYGGDTKFTTSTSAAIPQTVNQATTTTTLTASLNPSVFGQSVTFT